MNPGGLKSPPGGDEDVGRIPLSFVYGAILWGSVAAAAPVVIHLLMRSKPRKVVLPTLRFVKTTHRANISKLKLKHLILLVMRMAAIVLAVLILGRAFLPGYRSSDGSSVPSAVVVVVDNSASMGYRLGGRTLLDRGKQVAAEIVESLPAGSRVAVITTDPGKTGAGFLVDRKLAGQHVTDAADAATQQVEEPTLFDSQELPLTQAESSVFDVLAEQPLHTDEIIAQSELPPAQVNAALTSLQLKAVVKQLPGNYYKKRTRSR